MNQPDFFSAPSIPSAPPSLSVLQPASAQPGPTYPRARRNDPRSSHEAAAAIEASGRAAHQSAQVLAAVRLWPCSTSHELADAAHMDRYAIARRLPELAAAGRVRRIEPSAETVPCRISGKRVCRWEAV